MSKPSYVAIPLNVTQTMRNSVLLFVIVMTPFRIWHLLLLPCLRLTSYDIPPLLFFIAHGLHVADIVSAVFELFLVHTLPDFANSTLQRP